LQGGHVPEIKFRNHPNTVVGEIPKMGGETVREYDRKLCISSEINRDIET